MSGNKNKPSQVFNRQQPTEKVILTAESYRGEFPHPDFIARFEGVVENGPERIFSRFEKQSDHRMSLEKTVVEGDNRRANVGQIMGFILAAMLIIGGIGLAAYGKSYEGLSTIGLSVVGLITVTIISRKKREDEMQTKKQVKK